MFQINITAPEQVKPGENVSLKIKTAPNSFVGLTAVDQSVLLLRSNNDLRPHEFDWVLSSYTTTTPHQGGYSDYPGWSSGVVTLTNADYFYNWTKPEYLSSEFVPRLYHTSSKLPVGFHRNSLINFHYIQLPFRLN